jgi:uncharacterized protein (DUF885 family)
VSEQFGVAPQGRHERVVTAALDDLLAASPEWATGLGDHRFDDRLTDRSDMGLRDLRRSLSAHRDDLDSLDPEVMTVQEEVDVEILVNAIDARLFDTGVLAEQVWNPLVWLPGEALHPLLTSDALHVADRLRSIAARMEQIPEMLALAARTVQDPSLVHTETALDQTIGALGLVRDGVSELLAQEPSLGAIVAPAQEMAAAALEQHVAHLSEQLSTAAGNPRLGRSSFSARLHLTLDSSLGLDEIQGRALARLDQVEAQLDELTGGRTVEAIRGLELRAPTDVTVRAEALAALERITEVTRGLGLLTVFDEPIVIEEMPEFRRGVAIAYCDPPGPLEPPGRPTVVAISPTPSTWTAERVTSFYREYNSSMLVNLMVHEAMPGHALQLQHAARFVGTTDTRKVLWSGTFVEGWAVVAEELLAPHLGVDVQLMQLKMQLRMAINVLLDIGVHAGGMDEAEAMELMVGRGMQQEGEAVGKWRRALLTSTQLSTYFVGWSELSELFREHPVSDAVLAHGSPPPRHLRTLLSAG